jgi:hypothetical protein
LGDGGNGWIEIIDGSFNDYGSLSHLSTTFESPSDDTTGQSWAAVKGVASKPLWIKMLLIPKRI